MDEIPEEVVHMAATNVSSLGGGDASKALSVRFKFMRTHKARMSRLQAGIPKVGWIHAGHPCTLVCTDMIKACL